MAKQNKITLLGTGTSTGVPVIGCHCPICTSSNTANHRLRTSAFIETSKGSKILVDTSPDLRYQALRNKIEDVDSVILTHTHADHTHGIDDLRPFCFATTPQKNIPIYTSQKTKDELYERFPYIFQANKPILGGGIPHLELKDLPIGKDFFIDNEKFIFFELPHGHSETLCFIHEKLGYIVDCKMIPEHVIKCFHQAKLEVLIIECLREKPHSTHLHLEDTLRYIDLIRPKFAGLVHMAHGFDHDEFCTLLNKRYNGTVLPLQDCQTLEYKNEN